MQEGAITHYLEPVHFLDDLRCAGYEVYPTVRGVLLCPPEGRSIPVETRLTLFRTLPYLRRVLVDEGAAVLSDEEATSLARRSRRSRRTGTPRRQRARRTRVAM